MENFQMICQPVNVPNHPAWTIGHLVYSCQQIGGEIGILPWLPSDWGQHFGTGSIPVGDTAAYPDKEALLCALEDGKDRLTAALLAMEETDLSEPLPNVRYRKQFPTIGHAVVHILSGHTAMHLGPHREPVALAARGRRPIPGAPRAGEMILMRECTLG